MRLLLHKRMIIKNSSSEDSYFFSLKSYFAIYFTVQYFVNISSRCYFLDKIFFPEGL